MNYFASLRTFMRQGRTDTEVTKSLIQSTLRNNDIFGTGIMCPSATRVFSLHS